MSKDSASEGEKALSLGQFISQRRERLGLSQGGLAKRCMLELSEIESIEGGFELFLSSTVRQKLAKGLKVTSPEIKRYEIKQEYEIAPKNVVEEIKEQILQGACDITCPNCGTELEIRVAKMYDLEDNLILHPKARCLRCPFQIR
ncbi:transcriptional regulator XRE family [Candidatus Gastranaerophilus sp. (ex Termes propinquus)]|nr:transcriptional regulator XRE family [Candidatus Gastranaerophilus sp. (ex Termes propinquus)]